LTALPTPGIHLHAANVVVIALILLFFVVVLGGVIIRQILLPALFPTLPERNVPAKPPTNWPVLVICLGFLYGPFLAGFWWAWNRPCFLTLVEDGTLTLRNAYYLPMARIPGETPRTLETRTRKVTFESDAGHQKTLVEGDLWIQPAGGSEWHMPVPFFPETEAGDSSLLQNLGLSEGLVPLPGPHGGEMVSLHTFVGRIPVWAGRENPPAR
jgi:hypothetical protein